MSDNRRENREGRWKAGKCYEDENGRRPSRDERRDYHNQVTNGHSFSIDRVYGNVPMVKGHHNKAKLDAIKEGRELWAVTKVYDSLPIWPPVQGFYDPTFEKFIFVPVRAFSVPKIFRSC